MKSKIIIVGDFNEDINDYSDTGIKQLMSTTGVVQVFQELKSTIPSTCGNSRSIDHVFMAPDILKFVTQTGIFL